MSVRTSVKNIFNAITHPFGVDVVRHFGNELGLKQIISTMQQEQINLVLDIGANTGQYASKLLKYGYGGKIISFEPLDDVYPVLGKNASGHNNWSVYDRCAIGDYNGSTMINVSQNSHSSSILPITESHTKAAPSAGYIGQKETPIHTLDSIFPSFASASDKVCLKIDTQGFEDKVLAGAAQSLKKIKLIQLELSLLPLYEGSKTVEWMVPYLKSLHFEPVFFLPGFIDRTTEEIQQLEALFINKR